MKEDPGIPRNENGGNDMEKTYTPTPHNEAKYGDIAKTVLMPGDPLRAKYIAETWLENPVCFNQVRNMLGYTGTYKGKEVSVMGSGMGIPSIALYSYELYHFYGVESIIRVGSAGALQEGMELKDLVVAMGASTDSSYAGQLNVPGNFAPIADYGLLEKAVLAAREKNISVKVGNVLSADAFYNFDTGRTKRWADAGILAVEMESAALYVNAAQAKKKALSLLSISDHVFTGEELTAQERQLEFKNMIEVALEIA